MAILLCLPYLYLTESFPLAVEATAILLVVKVKLPGYPLAFPKAGSEVFIKKFHIFSLSNLFTYLSKKLMLLIGADK